MVSGRMVPTSSSSPGIPPVPHSAGPHPHRSALSFLSARSGSGTVRLLQSLDCDPTAAAASPADPDYSNPDHRGSDIAGPPSFSPEHRFLWESEHAAPLVGHATRFWPLRRRWRGQGRPGVIGLQVVGSDYCLEQSVDIFAVSKSQCCCCRRDASGATAAGCGKKSAGIGSGTEKLKLLVMIINQGYFKREGSCLLRLKCHVRVGCYVLSNQENKIWAAPYRL